MASAKQLAARRKFAKIMKSGGFKKRKSKTKKRIKSTIKVGGINYKATRTTTTLTKKQLLALKRRRKINKGVNKRSSVKRSLGLKSITGSSTIHSSMLLPLMAMLFVFLLYAALIFLMKYKTEIIRIKKKNIKRL